MAPKVSLRDKLERAIEDKRKEKDQFIESLSNFYLEFVNRSATKDEIERSPDYVRKASSLQTELEDLQKQLEALEEKESNTREGKRRHKEVPASSQTKKRCVGAICSSGKDDEGRRHAIDHEDAQDGDQAGDGGLLDEEEIREQVQKVVSSDLYMDLQGLQTSANETDCSLSSEEAKAKAVAEGPDSVEFKGQVFRRGDCCHYKSSSNNRDMIVGIQGFPPTTTAVCVLVAPFADTFLGIEEKGSEYKATFNQIPYVQIELSCGPLSLANFGGEHQQVKSIPNWAYEPQTKGSWCNFAYKLKLKRQRGGLRGELGLLDLFAGCGGMSQGFSNCGFTTAKAVEIDKNAAAAYEKNFGHCPLGDVEEFLENCKGTKDCRDKVGKVDHAHASSPCQGFSCANRCGGMNDKKNNDLSYTALEAVDIFHPLTESFENVPGMWRIKHVHYLKNILVGFLQRGYQVRCGLLNACDYGDPQARPRLFLFAARQCVYLPLHPQKTHGPGCTMDFVTVKEALTSLEAHQDHETRKKPKMTERKEPLKRLDADAPATTILATASKLPLHPDEDRQLTFPEAAALFSFPSGFKFVGRSDNQKLRQIGNAVPVEMATAVASSFKLVLKRGYEGE